MKPALIEMSTVVTKLWSVDLNKQALEEMILIAASDGEQTIELSDGRRFLISARAVTPKLAAKDFLLKAAPLAKTKDSAASSSNSFGNSLDFTFMFGWDSQSVES